MNTHQTIIVYRNPAEAAMWDMIMNSTVTWMVISIIGGVAAGLVVYIAMSLYLQTFVGRWYQVNKHRIEHAMWFITAAVMLFVIWKLWI